MRFPGSGCVITFTLLLRFLRSLLTTSPKHTSLIWKPHCNANMTALLEEGGGIPWIYEHTANTVQHPPLHTCKAPGVPRFLQTSPQLIINWFFKPRFKKKEEKYSSVWNKDKTDTCAHHHVAVAAHFINFEKNQTVNYIIMCIIAKQRLQCFVWACVCMLHVNPS